MKMSLTFPVTVFLMAVLFFSTPFVTIAQQDAEVADTKTTPAVLLTGDHEGISAGLFFLGVGIGRTYIYSTDIASPYGGEFSLSYETPSYAVGVEFRLNGDLEHESGSDSLLFISFSISGRYFFFKQYMSPYIGGGLAVVSIDYKKNVKEFIVYCARQFDWFGITDPPCVNTVGLRDTYEQELGSGLGMYGIVGIEFMRFTWSRLNLELRVDRPFFKLPSIDVMPLSLGITYSVAF